MMRLERRNIFKRQFRKHFIVTNIEDKKLKKIIIIITSSYYDKDEGCIKCEDLT
jgi:hypothetical protein